MRKRSSKDDPNQAAFAAVEELLSRSEKPTRAGKNPAAVALGRLGGLKGGRARADKLSRAERSESAKKAALARWASKK